MLIYYPHLFHFQSTNKLQFWNLYPFILTHAPHDKLHKVLQESSVYCMWASYYERNCYTKQELPSCAAKTISTCRLVSKWIRSTIIWNSVKTACTLPFINEYFINLFFVSLFFIRSFMNQPQTMLVNISSFIGKGCLDSHKQIWSATHYKDWNVYTLM